MTTTTPAVSQLERTITLALPVASIDVEIGARLKNLQRTVKMQGFRPGKVPLRMVEQYYGMQVRQDVLNDQLEKAFTNSVRTGNLKVAGFPRFAPANQENAAPGTDIQINATFEVYPDVTIGDLAAKTIVQSTADVVDADVDRTLETLRKQRATFAPVERAAKEGDMALIEFEGKLEGVPFDGGKAANFGVVLGEKRMVPGFEDGLVGMKTGETKTYPVTFPEDYNADNLKGKLTDFTVTLQQLSEPILPPIDTAFAKNFGIESGDVGELRAEVKNNLEREAKRRSLMTAKEQVMQSLTEAHEFTLPQTLIEMEISKMQEQAKADLKGRGMTTTDMALPRDLFVQGAERRVKLGLVVAQIIQQNDLKPDPKRVRELIEEQAQSYEDPQALVRWIYTQPERIGEVESLVLENAVVEWAMGKMKVESKKVPLFDLMGQAT